MQRKRLYTKKVEKSKILPALLRGHLSRLCIHATYRRGPEGTSGQTKTKVVYGIQHFQVRLTYSLSREIKLAQEEKIARRRPQ